MRRYKVQIEGAFIRAPQLGELIGGFHGTFLSNALTPQEAVRAAVAELRDRMTANSVTLVRTGVIRSYARIEFVVGTDEADRDPGLRKPSGFTYFRIGIRDKTSLVMQRIFLELVGSSRLIRL